MSKILVTGGAGFVGSHVTEALLQREHRVVVLDNLTGGSVDHVPPAARLVIGDICDYARMKALFEENSFDYVYHLAASPVDSLLYHVRYGTYEVNLMGSLNLISASIRTGVKCIMFASSTAVYGRHVAGVAREDATPTHPEDSESIAKLAVEQELGLAQKMFGLDHVIFRLHHVCGARQRLENTQDHAIGRFVMQALQQMPMTPDDDDAAIVSFADVRDVAARLAEAPEVAAARNQTFNIGADYTCSERELAMAVARAVGVEARVANAPVLAKHPALRISQERLESVFRHYPGRHLTDTLMTLVNWVKAQGLGQPREASRPAAWAIRQ